MQESAGITGTTRLYGIVGDPIAQVRVPEVINPRFAERNIDAVVLPLHVRPADVEAAFAGFTALANLDGLIITVPHKFAFARLAAELGPRARVTGDANILRRRPDGGWEGELYDGLGFVEGMRSQGIDPQQKSYLVVGSGGAGTAIAAALLETKPTRIAVSDVDADRAAHLAAVLVKAAPELTGGPLAVETLGPDPDPGGYDVVVNATPLGMREDDPLPYDPARLSPGAIAAEAIMKPPVTRLLREAEMRGHRIHPGRHMLDAQIDLFLEYWGLS